MKKSLILILVCALLLSMAACGNADNNESDADEKSKVSDTSDIGEVSLQEVVAKGVVKDFVNHINNSEYSKAIELYANEIIGNYEDETSAQEAVLTMCENINARVLMGTCDEKEANQKLNVIERVVDGTDMSIADFNQIKHTIMDSIASKTAFNAAKDFESHGNYADAIFQYKSVVKEDSNYTAAVEAIDRCSASLKSEAFDKAQSFASQKKYFEAIEALKTASAVLPDDSEILGKITVYEQTHKKDAIDSAAEAFVTPITDYEAALACINSALQYYPDDAELLAKKEYYASFAPVNLYDMNPIKGSVNKKTTDKSSYNDSYTKCLYTSYSTDATYHLKKAYNTFSATVYGTSDSNEEYYGTIKVYADGKIIYENLKVELNGKPFDIKLDITGVEELRIYFKSGYTGYRIGITNAVIQRTVA